MASVGDISKALLVLISLLCVLPVVEAVEAGDGIALLALLLGMFLSLTGICACLGIYARKRNGQM